MSKDKIDNKTGNKIEMRVLTDTHKHAGKPCKKNDRIWVSDNTRKFLEANNIAERVSK